MVSELVWSNELLEGLKSMKFQNKVDGQVTPTKKKIEMQDDSFQQENWDFASKRDKRNLRKRLSAS